MSHDGFLVGDDGLGVADVAGVAGFYLILWHFVVAYYSCYLGF
jgi:hypothetical protein